MRTIKIKSGITISYQDKGKKSAPVIIMIMGLGAQLTVWPDELYFGLVAKGFRAIRFDNRDTGLSSQLEQFGSPNLFKIWLNKRLPIKSRIPYTLDDMANDVLELMAELKIKKAHLVGASMGGMIAQIIAAKHKKKVLSLTSIMSSSSKPKLSASNLKLFLQLAKHRRAQASRDGAIHYNIRLNQLIGSPAYPQDELALRKQATLGVDRAHNPQGFNRQLAAITASDCRQHLMPKIKAPTLVIHGSLDPVMPIAAGKQTAAQIRKAKLKIVNGMGHDFPPALMVKMTKWISKHVKKAEQKRAQKKLKKAVSGKR
ncbi:alpha/beta hydrolase [Pseudoalteromonas sp. SR41-8]|uniref:alpha/beta fold hydrolase n=1 Tax=Pseudoalteromonas sp. SR41-8 TaxID=2760946 RepID=UPI001602687E|nr:alpha/beta hydrolase [Pseudoalteromonas sp. SR41-8]MBB1311703.1 alpha/beta hydrolase [Pseudoalteromonas sp. SR41-8]